MQFPVDALYLEQLYIGNQTRSADPIMIRERQWLILVGFQYEVCSKELEEKCTAHTVLS